MEAEKRKMFEPKGEKPEWLMVFDAIKDRQDGAVVRYEELQHILGRDVREGRSPIYRATKELERERGVTLRAVKNRGYLLCLPEQNLPIAYDRVKRSRRQVAKGVHTIANTRRSKLSPEDAQKADNMTQWLKIELRRLKISQRRLERNLEREATERKERDAELESKIHDMQHEIAAMKRKIGKEE
jgi:hypothetical protein